MGRVSRRQNHSSSITEVNVGMQGVICTCVRGMERQSLKEAYALFNDV